MLMDCMPMKVEDRKEFLMNNAYANNPMIIMLVILMTSNRSCILITMCPQWSTYLTSR